MKIRMQKILELPDFHGAHAVRLQGWSHPSRVPSPSNASMKRDDVSRSRRQRAGGRRANKFEFSRSLFRSEVTPATCLARGSLAAAGRRSRWSIPSGVENVGGCNIFIT